jgi:hypothetical protein
MYTYDIAAADMFEEPGRAVGKFAHCFHGHPAASAVSKTELLCTDTSRLSSQGGISAMVRCNTQGSVEVSVLWTHKADLWLHESWR